MNAPGEHRFRTQLQRILFEEGRRQDWLARETGIDEGRLSHFVNGNMRPGPVNRQKIADALGRSDEADTLFLPDVPCER